MDAGQLLQLLVLLAVASVIGQLAITSAARAGDGLAMLFVPPDRGLGWPRGVQESDEPWAWRSALPPPPEVVTPVASAGGDSFDPHSTDDLIRVAPRTGALVVPVERVGPVHFGVRPH